MNCPALQRLWETSKSRIWGIKWRSLIAEGAPAFLLRCLHSMDHWKVNKPCQYKRTDVKQVLQNRFYFLWVAKPWVLSAKQAHSQMHSIPLGQVWMLVLRPRPRNGQKALISSYGEVWTNLAKGCPLLLVCLGSSLALRNSAEFAPRHKKFRGKGCFLSSFRMDILCLPLNLSPWFRETCSRAEHLRWS